MSQGMTEVDHGWEELLLLDSSPEFQLISVALTLVAVVTLSLQIDGERSSAGRGGAVNGARAVQLIAGAGGGLEVELRQYALHGDFLTQTIEVDAGHRFPFGVRDRAKEDRSVPSSSL
jgi:hypothetical protein